MGAGYTGKVLMVDLTKREVETLELGRDVYRDFLGGYGLGARILFAHIPKGADPLGPDNVLGLAPGLLTGSPAFSVSAVCSALPMTRFPRDDRIPEGPNNMQVPESARLNR